MDAAAGYYMYNSLCNKWYNSNSVYADMVNSNMNVQSRLARALIIEDMLFIYRKLYLFKPA